MRSKGGRDDEPASVAMRDCAAFFRKSSRTDGGRPTRLSKVVGMKIYSTRYRRRTLLPVPYSVRLDRLERSIRMLCAFRLSLAAQVPTPCAPQCEFEFAMRKLS